MGSGRRGWWDVEGGGGGAVRSAVRVVCPEVEGVRGLKTAQSLLVGEGEEKHSSRAGASRWVFWALRLCSKCVQMFVRLG